MKFLVGPAFGCGAFRNRLPAITDLDLMAHTGTNNGRTSARALTRRRMGGAQRNPSDAPPLGYLLKGRYALPILRVFPFTRPEPPPICLYFIQNYLFLAGLTKFGTWRRVNLLLLKQLIGSNRNNCLYHHDFFAS